MNEKEKAMATIGIWIAVAFTAVFDWKATAIMAFFAIFITPRM